MKTITVQIPVTKNAGKYKILVGSGIVGTIGSLLSRTHYSKALVVTDGNVPPAIASGVVRALPMESHVCVLPAGEKQKHIGSIETIWHMLLSVGCDRASLIINVGGGVVCDVGGFAASTYMRGIDFLHIPTTLVAQADAAVGGKTGVNLGGVKNVIGTFRQPIGVLCDVDTLASLPDREFASGFGEIIKHGLIRDRNFFEIVTAKAPNAWRGKGLEAVIARSCQIKADIVSSDETEQGVRKLLNFGHTVGHALEALSLATDKPLLHGEAVLLGMIVESEISRRIGLLADGEAADVIGRLSRLLVPVVWGGITADMIIGKMRADKKSVGGNIQWTLLTHIGGGIIHQQVSDEIVRESLMVVRKENL